MNSNSANNNASSKYHPFLKMGKELGVDYIPTADVVIIGRGKRVASHPGNKRFKQLVKEELPAYAAAPSKTEKSYILAKLLHQVRRWHPQRLGFVKQCPRTGMWSAPKDSVSRVTVAQAFRDALSTRYSSSKHSKQRRRQIAKGYVSAAQVAAADANLNREFDSPPHRQEEEDDDEEVEEPIRSQTTDRWDSYLQQDEAKMEAPANNAANNNISLRSAFRHNLKANRGTGSASGHSMSNMPRGPYRGLSAQQTLDHIRGIVANGGDPNKELLELEDTAITTAMPMSAMSGMHGMQGMGMTGMAGMNGMAMQQQRSMSMPMNNNQGMNSMNMNMGLMNQGAMMSSMNSGMGMGSMNSSMSSMMNGGMGSSMNGMGHMQGGNNMLGMSGGMGAMNMPMMNGNSMMMSHQAAMMGMNMPSGNMMMMNAGMGIMPSSSSQHQHGVIDGFDPLPVVEDGDHDDDAFAASEQTSAFFLQHGM